MDDIESLSPSLRIEDDGVIGTITVLKKWKGFTKISQSLVPAKEVAALVEFGVPQEATYKVFCEFVLVLFFPVMSELYLSVPSDVKPPSRTHVSVMGMFTEANKI